jgi:hypothetical protein
VAGINRISGTKLCVANGGPAGIVAANQQQMECKTMLRYIAVYGLSSLMATQLYSQVPPRTPEQVLTQAGISLDKESLLQGLDDNRPGILASVATVLAEKRIVEAIPAIKARMMEEQDKHLEITLAQSLNTLGSKDGTDRLKEFCLGNDMSTGERMRAAYALLYTDNYSCLPAMPELLNSDHADERQGALLYLRRIPSPQSNAPGTLGPALLDVAASDPDKELRTLAKQVIDKIGDPTTRDVLLKQEREATK